MNWIKNHKYLAFVALLFIIFFFPLPIYAVYQFFFPTEYAADWNGLFLFLWAFLGMVIFIPLFLIWTCLFFYRLAFPKKFPTTNVGVALDTANLE